MKSLKAWCEYMLKSQKRFETKQQKSLIKRTTEVFFFFLNTVIWLWRQFHDLLWSASWFFKCLWLRILEICVRFLGGSAARAGVVLLCSFSRTEGRKAVSIQRVCHSRWCPGSKGRNNLIQGERETRNQKTCVGRGQNQKLGDWAKVEGSRRGLGSRNGHVYSWWWNYSLQKSSSPESLCSAMKPTAVKITTKMCGCTLGNSLPLQPWTSRMSEIIAEFWTFQSSSWPWSCGQAFLLLLLLCLPC